MSAKVIEHTVAPIEGHRFRVLLDASKVLEDGAPDPAWIVEYAWGAYDPETAPLVGTEKGAGANKASHKSQDPTHGVDGKHRRMTETEYEDMIFASLLEQVGYELDRRSPTKGAATGKLHGRVLSLPKS